MAKCLCIRRKNRGFTLIELVTVIVILGIMAALGSGFVVSTLNSYDVTQKRLKAIAKGRVSIEQMTRALRLSVPNSVRVSSSGNCIEYLPVLAGAVYEASVADSANGLSTSSSISVLDYNLGSGTPAHVVVGALDASEIYSTGSPNSRTDVGSYSGSAPFNVVPMSNSTHRFLRNSIVNRVFVTTAPERFCLAGGALIRYQNYGLDTSSLNDSDPGGVGAIMAQNVSTNSRAFTLSNGSEDRNTAIFISLNYTQNDVSVELNQEVLVRNVP